MRSLTIVVLVAVALCATACTTVQTVNGYQVAGKESATTTKTNSTGLVEKVENVSEVAMTPDAAKYRIKMAQIAAEVEKTKAKAEAKAARVAADAANPCRNWFMAPSYCYGYGTYGYSSTGPVGPSRVDGYHMP